MKLHEIKQNQPLMLSLLTKLVSSGKTVYLKSKESSADGLQIDRVVNKGDVETFHFKNDTRTFPFPFIFRTSDVDAGHFSLTRDGDSWLFQHTP